MNHDRQLKRAVVFSLLSVAFILTLSRFFSAFGAEMPSPDEVLALLTSGNQHFAADQPSYPRIGPARRAEVADGQHPLATVISCSDSRVPPEILFGAGIGDLFVVRVIGNISSGDETGSAEYGVEHLKTPLLVVLGHTNCGAVTAVVTKAKVAGNIPPILANIIPAVLTASRENPDLKGMDLVPAATQANVFYSMEQLFKRSETIRNKTLFGKLKVIGALYDIKSGQVAWLGPHPRQESLLSDEGTKKSPPKQNSPTRRGLRRKD